MKASGGLRPTELRMEFYVNILQDFAAALENIPCCVHGPQVHARWKGKYY